MTARDATLVGRRTLVIGAGTPAGGVAGIALAQAGADVAVAAGSIEGDEVMAVRRIRRAIEALGRRTAEYAMDLTLGANIRVSTRQVAKEMGGLDVLVNAADAYLCKDAEATSDAEWARVLNINLSGVFYACRAALKEMAASGGSIVNICSLQGGILEGPSAAYVAAKHGVVGLTRALAAEYQGRGIRVNAIVLEWPHGIGQLPPFAPLPFTGDTNQLAHQLVRLASDASANGQVVALDGRPGAGV